MINNDMSFVKLKIAREKGFIFDQMNQLTIIFNLHL